MIKYYNYPADKNVKLSEHFVVGEFVTFSDYHGNYPSKIPIDSKLPEVLEMVYKHFGCTYGEINSGYRTSACDRSVGGSGSGPHTLGIAVDVYFKKNGQPIPSRLVACYLEDLGIKGIGLNCGGNPDGTHIDVRGFGVWNDKFWHGDEAKVDKKGNYALVSNFYKYTGTSKSEVYSSGSAQSSTVMTTDPTVRVVQVWLNRTYGLNLATDGIYGNETRRALVRGLQHVLNAKFGTKLDADGIFGAKTKAAIQPCAKGTRGAYPSILQAFLICKGYNVGSFDGVYGNQTANAVIQFQKDKGLVADGIAGKATFAKLVT